MRKGLDVFVEWTLSDVPGMRKKTGVFRNQ